MVTKGLVGGKNHLRWFFFSTSKPPFWFLLCSNIISIPDWLEIKVKSKVSEERKTKMNCTRFWKRYKKKVFPLKIIRKNSKPVIERHCKGLSVAFFKLNLITVKSELMIQFSSDSNFNQWHHIKPCNRTNLTDKVSVEHCKITIVERNYHFSKIIFSSFYY